VNRALTELLLDHDDLADLDPPARRLEVRRLLSERQDANLTLSEVIDHIEGAGPLTALLNGSDVTDVLVNGHDEVWVERGGTLERTDVRFEDEASLRALIERWLGDGGATADISHPIADVRLRDGSRLHVVLPPVSTVPLVSIRRHPVRAPSLDELVERGMLSDGQAMRLRTAVSDRSSIAISGATGTGKTTMLGSLLSLVPASERIVVLEETRELACSAPHSVSLLTRPPNAEGSGGIELVDLVRASLRMRPDRIVVGEVRGAEALALLGALNTGHRGSLVTIHASSSERVVDRMVTLALQAPTSLREDVVRAEAGRAWDLFVHLERDGTQRRVTEIRRADRDG
jgi:pilus assembly protein CpaF